MPPCKLVLHVDLFVFQCLWQNFTIRCWIHSKWTIQREGDRRKCKTINCCKWGQATQSSEEGFVTSLFLLVCSSALHWCCNSPVAVDFSAFLPQKIPSCWVLVSSVETEELHIPFIPASFWNKWFSRQECCLLLSYTHPQQNSSQLGLILCLVVAELQVVTWAVEVTAGLQATGVCLK